MVNENLEHVRFQIGDIGDGDVDRVETALSGINGVRDVEVNPDGGAVEVSYSPVEVSVPKLKEALIAEGYTVDGGDSVGGGLPEGTASSTDANDVVLKGEDRV